MNKRQMQTMSGGPQSHQCAPKDWRDVPDMTGDYDLDATIQHRNNSDLPDRLNMYLRRGGKAYGPITGYNGYQGYHGDN